MQLLVAQIDAPALALISWNAAKAIVLDPNRLILAAVPPVEAFIVTTLPELPFMVRLVYVTELPD